MHQRIKTKTFMLMKKQLLFAAMLLAGQSLHATDYPYLTFEKSDGTLQSVSVASLTLIYSDGMLTATNADGSVKLTLSELTRMYFSTTSEGSGGEPTAIGSVEASGEECAVTVYNLQGMEVGKYESMSEARSLLRHGVYIVESDKKRVKVTIK